MGFSIAQNQHQEWFLLPGDKLNIHISTLESQFTKHCLFRWKLIDGSFSIFGGIFLDDNGDGFRNLIARDRSMAFEWSFDWGEALLGLRKISSPQLVSNNAGVSRGEHRGHKSPASSGV